MTEGLGEGWGEGLHNNRPVELPPLTLPAPGGPRSRVIVPGLNTPLHPLMIRFSTGFGAFTALQMQQAMPIKNFPTVGVESPPSADDMTETERSLKRTSHVGISESSLSPWIILRT